MKATKEHKPQQSRVIQCHLRKSRDAIQLQYSETNDADVHYMWWCRNSLNIANSRLSNNVASCGNKISRSDLGGHSEPKVVGLYLSDLCNEDIHVFTERQPCQYCEEFLRNISDNTKTNMFVHYLIDYQYSGGNKELKNTYRNARLLR